MAFGEDFREEIRVDQFWRNLLQPDDFQRFRGEDLYRWYKAMEVRGTTDIRSHLVERKSRAPEGDVHGLVSAGPHPPFRIVQIWLDYYDKRPWAFSVWSLGIAFLMLCVLGAGLASQCAISITEFPHMLAPTPQ